MPCSTPGEPLATAAPPASLDADEPSRGVGETREDAGCVGAASDAGNHEIGLAHAKLEQLRCCFYADDALELTDHPRERDEVP